jgi:hypothetical protein
MRAELVEARLSALRQAQGTLLPPGCTQPCCLLRLGPTDMIKLGELYLGEGVWHGSTDSCGG